MGASMGGSSSSYGVHAAWSRNGQQEGHLLAEQRTEEGRPGGRGGGTSKGAEGGITHDHPIIRGISHAAVSASATRHSSTQPTAARVRVGVCVCARARMRVCVQPTFVHY